MKKLLILAALATGIASASAQTPNSRSGSTSAAQRASTDNRDSPSNSAITPKPNYSTGNGQRTGKKTDTTPATGPTRASRSSSKPKTAGQSRPTGSGNIESVSKNDLGGTKPKK
jgi:hypothetical protein